MKFDKNNNLIEDKQYLYESLLRLVIRISPKDYKEIMQLVDKLLN